jgi:hypothetical protein
MTGMFKGRLSHVISSDLCIGAAACRGMGRDLLAWRPVFGHLIKRYAHFPVIDQKNASSGGHSASSDIKNLGLPCPREAVRV